MQAESGTGSIAVIGEALIDLTEAGDDDPRLARPGGSPYNVAIGLARLGQRTYFVGRLSRDPFGRILRNHALRSGVDLSLCVDAPEPSTVAVVELDAGGAAQYRFDIEGSADFRWTDAELAAVSADISAAVPADISADISAGISAGISAVHFGSLASWLPPGDAAIARRVAALRAAGALVTYDPNVRPHLQPDRATARAQVEAAIPLAHLVKTSEEDIAYLHPGTPAEDVAAAWLAMGPQAVVVTRGDAGALAATASGVVARPPQPVELVDTVGAGDAFTSGLLDALARRGLLRPDAIGTADFGPLLDDAGLVAAITCGRAGANPPRRSEL